MPGAERVTQDRAGVTAIDGAVDRSRHRGWQRNQDDLAALAPHAQDPWPCSSPKSPMLAPHSCA
jgi:hypothetical protein